MCMQCMATAMTAGAGVTGARAYLAHKHFAWMTPRRMRALTIALISAGLLASATLVGGSTKPPTAAPVASQHAPAR